MDTERSPLANKTVPRYTFLGNGRPPKHKIGSFQCCVCAALMALLIVTLLIILSYYLSPSNSDVVSDNERALDGLLHLKWPIKEKNYLELLGDSDDEAKALEVGVRGLEEKDFIENMIPPVAIGSPAFKHQLATPTTREAQEMSRLGFVLTLAAKEMSKCFENNTAWNKEKPRRWLFAQSPKWYPRDERHLNKTVSCALSTYRTANGTCNNLVDPSWGAALSAFRRILLPDYEDGISLPRRASDGTSLPSAREVSLAIHRPFYRNDVNFTIMLAVWGQFIDHDITATAISKGKNRLPISCCQTKYTHPECFPVLLKSSDPLYVQHNVTCMEFVRSAPAPTRAFGPREQLNQATSFLDGSVVYGNNNEVMNQLRTFSGGTLKMLRTSAGDLLPVSEDPEDGCNAKEQLARGRYCFLSGDQRSNENLLLASMHLLFVRLHNSIAEKLANVNPLWTDEKLFQETRKIVGALIQHITYNEFLPSVLPEKLMVHLNISTRSEEASDSYNASVDPTIANVFASAAFRFGHSLLPGLIQFSKDNSTRREYLELHKMLFNPFQLFESQFLENFLKGAINTSSAKSDIYFSREVTQKLFQKEPENTCGLDLVTLNIQRGRDHGLPSYPNWRTICGLTKPSNFSDLKGVMENSTLRKLEKLYKSVDDLDLYTGGLAEKPVDGGLLGPTITCLIADQFLRLKIGDRYWYERMKESHGFTPEQLNEIRRFSLATVICETSGVTECQPHVMRRAGAKNALTPCHKLSSANFEAWREI